MHPDLEGLIRLQDLENAAESARRQIAEMPIRVQALETRLEERRAAVAGARQRLTDSQLARRAVEKDLAAMQSRLSKFKDQLMEVKTNKEYQAVQKEISVAEHEVRVFEDQVLERMLEADELSAALKQAQTELAREDAAVTSERAALEQERAGLEHQLERSVAERVRLTAGMTPSVLALFEHVARGRKGVAVTEARAGHCSVCHVRLRPQVFNEVQGNESIIQCESCQRILYFVPAAVT